MLSEKEHDVNNIKKLDDELEDDENPQGRKGSSDDDQDDGNIMFGSAMNLGGGGAAIVQTRKEELKLRKRAQANFALCGAGMVAGAGMFSESYFLFALGNIKHIWHEQYPSCFNSSLAEEFGECNTNLVSSLTYIEVLGVIFGMLTFGFFADILGRRWGSCSTATIMFVGGVLTAAAYAGPDNLTGQFIFFAAALFLFSYGVGGEYPLASASAAERAEAARKSKSGTQHHIRGKSVVFVFAQQGLGNWVNTLVIMLILIGVGCTTNEECSYESLDLTWRLQYAIGAAFLCILMIGRLVFLQESKVWLANKDKKKRNAAVATENASDIQARKHSIHKLAYKFYWSRMVGTAIGWLVWDIVFYGNKLFQGTIIAAIVGGTPSIFTILAYTLINSSVALVGYYAAALIIDKPWMGRKRLQNIGFFMTFILFLVCGISFDELSKPENAHWLQLLYYLSSFFGQCGPNSTTWLLPSELFPTDVRTLAHGLSASSGKLGALTATILFTYGASGDPLGTRSIFLVCSICGLIGLAITTVFVPDVTTLDLSCMDERFEFIKEGRVEDYHGPARDAQYLSFYEKVSGHGCNCKRCACRNCDDDSSVSSGEFQATV